VILHPGVLALLGGSAVALALLVAACGVGIQVLRRWDFSSSSARQLALERRTFLVSSLATVALAIEIASSLLFLYTVDDLHRLFVGAMCATGSLNANPVGWWVLPVKVLILLAAPLWIALNGLDVRAGDFPVIRAKYGALLVLAPLVAADLVLQARYFLGLDPAVITSCCGSLFSAAGSGVSSELAGLPVFPTMAAFYASVAAFVAAMAACRLRPAAITRIITAALALVFLAVALASMVSFLSLYIYELPTHHCPFDVLQLQYRAIGYPLYASLFAAVVLGLLPAVTLVFRRRPSFAAAADRAQRRWLDAGLAATILFVVLASFPVLFGSFTMRGY
jgi:hypothetical protein